jgi:hypothetical protein
MDQQLVGQLVEVAGVIYWLMDRQHYQTPVLMVVVLMVVVTRG